LESHDQLPSKFVPSQSSSSSFVSVVTYECRYDFQVTGYDTVIQLMKNDCWSTGKPSDGPQEHIIDCNDDGVPPGFYGSHISGEISNGTYYVMIDGYSTTDNGPFEMVAFFVKDCIPLCDGNRCGDDSCGGVCGTCEEGEECNSNDNRCYPENCTPLCSERECGEDGCGGSCGVCEGENMYCLGESIFSEDDTIPTSTCELFEPCDHFNPVCNDCSSEQICASDCQCYDSLADLPDLIILEEDLLNESYLQDLTIPKTSCSFIEGCVGGTGLRRLLRFTSSVLNQGQADMHFPVDKERPDLFEYGVCHQHYHFRNFATYKLYAEDGKTVVVEGKKSAHCMEDTVRYFDGATFSCDRVYDCGFQGIQSGWMDQYGWSLDCSWVDVTGIGPGNYVLEINLNPLRILPEVSHENNIGRVRVSIPEIEGTVPIPTKLQTSVYEDEVTTADEGEEDFGGVENDSQSGSSEVYKMSITSLLSIIFVAFFQCFF
jgi:hypothetical protein